IASRGSTVSSVLVPLELQDLPHRLYVLASEGVAHKGTPHRLDKTLFRCGAARPTKGGLVSPRSATHLLVPIHIAVSHVPEGKLERIRRLALVQNKGVVILAAQVVDHL